MKKVLAGGTFNLVHPGHVFFLKKAKEFGDYLIVVVAHDETVLKRKGYLLKTAEKRKKEIEKTGIPDKVVIGDSKDFLKVVEKEKPDIIVLGYDQMLDRKTKSRLQALGCKVIKIKSKLKGYKTSKMIKNKRKITLHH